MKKTFVTTVLDKFPPEIRVENIANGLEGSGNKIVALANKSGKSASRWHGEIRSISSQSRITQIFLRTRRRLSATIKPAFGDSVLSLNWMYTQLKDLNADALIWNDLREAHVGLALANKIGAKFILDLHESFPFNMWSTSRDQNGNSRRFMLDAWLNYEGEICRAADLILTPGQEMNERLNGMHFIEHSKMTEYLNTEAFEDWDDAPIIETGLEQFANRDILVYVGSMSIHRGIDLMIEAIHLVRDKWPNLLFAIVGEGRALAGLKKKVGELGLNGQVLFFGKRPFSEMASFIRQARIGVVPHYRYPQTDGGAPHKFFQYMSVGKPVLVSNCSTLERIVRTHNSGVVFHAGDVNDLAQKLLTLKDQSLRKKLGENGRKAMEGPLHLKRQQRKLNNKIAELLNT